MEAETNDEDGYKTYSYILLASVQLYVEEHKLSRTVIVNMVTP